MIRMRTQIIVAKGFLLILLGLGFGTVATAQDTLPQSPPELKDFRLDTPPPREDAPAPQPPAPQPKAETPPAKQPAQPAAQPAKQAPAKAQPAPVRAQPVPESGTPVQTNLDGSAEAEALAPADISETAIGTDAALPVPVVPEAQNAKPSGMPEWLSWWPYLAALLTALAAFLLLHHIRQRKAKMGAMDLAPVPSTPIPVRKQSPPKPVLASATSLTARFETGDARLSLANLTITGQLHLHYAGAVPLQKLSMRTFLMSACDGQAAMIDAFHSDETQGDREILGSMIPSESINLKLQLQVPRDGLQAFDWRERRFVAPIIVVNISGDDLATPCRLACVVGQVGDPDSPRLLPIPIDRGPKRFDRVQFQPIAA